MKRTTDFLLYLNLTLFLFFISACVKAHECRTFNEVKEIFSLNLDKPITNIDNSITIEEAYCTQDKLNYLIKKKYADKVGYKVGFTGKATQKKFNISEPAIGILYEHMFIKNNATIDKNFAYRPLIEPDLLVVINSSDIMLATSNEAIFSYIESIHPYIELPALRFKPKDKVTGPMLIAANMMATKMVLGEGIIINHKNSSYKELGIMETVFFTDGENKEILQKASTKNLMGNPINVLKWLIKFLNDKGETLKKGDMVSLGSLGKLFPLKSNTKYLYSIDGFNTKKIVGVNTK